MKSVFYILTVFISTFVAICVVGLFIFLASRSGPLNSDIESFEYQYLNRNDETKSTNFGYVSLPNIIQENDFISYKDDNGNSILISNFGEEEYECSGTCYCESIDGSIDNRRSSSIPLFSRGLSYLLVSISSVRAFQIAEKYFKTKCEEEFSEKCGKFSKVKSFVDLCIPTIRQSVEEKEIEEERKKKEDYRTYYCFGNCLENGNFRMGHASSTRRKKAQKMLDDFNCYRLKQEGEITIFEKGLIVKTASISQKYRQTAQNKFQERYLVSFCKENSKVNYINDEQFTKYTTKKTKEEKKYPKHRKETGFACVGKSKGRGVNSRLRNIKCRQIDPKPETPNNEYFNKKFLERKKEWDEGDPLV